jgi:hypothetical protein
MSSLRATAKTRCTGGLVATDCSVEQAQSSSSRVVVAMTGSMAARGTIGASTGWLGAETT